MCVAYTYPGRFMNVCARRLRALSSCKQYLSPCICLQALAHEGACLIARGPAHQMDGSQSHHWARRIFPHGNPRATSNTGTHTHRHLEPLTMLALHSVAALELDHCLPVLGRSLSSQKLSPNILETFGAALFQPAVVSAIDSRNCSSSCGASDDYRCCLV